MGVISEINIGLFAQADIRLPRCRVFEHGHRGDRLPGLGHHLFVSTQSVYAGLVFSFLSYFVANSSAVKVFNWTATLL